MNNSISVIIPAYNEEKSIEKVVQIAKENANVDEIIVVDNLSTDTTSEIAKKVGAKVVDCNNQGKGYAMEVGLYEAKNEIVVFLDADIEDYNANIVEILANPLIEGNVDFVKSTFDRITGGNVTQIATKPLLNILFPNMYKFSEPLSGMIASKKSILEKLEFEKDYGVDIGILLDIIKMKLTVEEVNIGKLKNLSHMTKTQEWMSKMSTEIMRAILKRTNIKIEE